MKTAFLSAALPLLLLYGCTKEAPAGDTASFAETSQPKFSFTQYTIPQGEHYASGNVPKAIETGEMKFTVKFDGSAVYRTANPDNQYDINKLYGFSDNGGPHHLFSARMGWRWSDGALRLFAYTYNNGVRDSKELDVVPIGKEVRCAIKATGEVYRFTVDEKTETMPRLSTTPTAKGYQLYPYFGGDEAAPHEIRIWIREE